MTTTQPKKLIIKPKKKLIIKPKKTITFNCKCCGDTNIEMYDGIDCPECSEYVCDECVISDETDCKTDRCVECYEEEKKKLFLDKHKKKNSKVMAELLRERKGCKKLSIKIVLDCGVVVRYYYISDSWWALPDW